MRSKHCCYGLCNSDTRYNHRASMKGVFFIPFPKPISNRQRCLKWIAACGRQNFGTENITYNSYVCSKHFVGENGPTRENPDPVTFDPVTMIDDMVRYDRRRKAVTGGAFSRQRVISYEQYPNSVYPYFTDNNRGSETRGIEIFGEQVSIILEEEDRILGPSDNAAPFMLAHIKLEPAESDSITDSSINSEQNQTPEASKDLSINIVTANKNVVYEKQDSKAKTFLQSSDYKASISEEIMSVDCIPEVYKGCSPILISNNPEIISSDSCTQRIENLLERYKDSNRKGSISITACNSDSQTRHQTKSTSDTSQPMTIDVIRNAEQDKNACLATTEFVPLHDPVAFADDLYVTPNPVYVFNSSNSNVRLGLNSAPQFESLNDLSSQFKIPKGWSVMCNDDIIVFTVINDNTTGALKSLSISDDLSTSVKILNKTFDVSSVSNSFPTKINSEVVLQNALKEMKSWHICTGNTENRFLELIRREHEQKGFYCWITNAARSNKCTLVTDTDQARCQRCSCFRMSIRSATSRQKTQHLSAVASTPELLVQRIRESATEKKLLSEKLLRIQKELEFSIQKDNEKLSMEDDSCSTD